MPSLEHRIPPPVVAIAIAALMWWVPGSSFALAIPAGWRIGAAAVIALAGLACTIAGVRAFIRAKTTTNPFMPSAASALVSDGVYRFTRNPMYLGMLLVLAAWAVFLASPVALAGPPLFVLYMNRFQIAPEERALAERFGVDYDAYRRRVRRWL